MAERRFEVRGSRFERVGELRSGEMDAAEIARGAVDGQGSGGERLEDAVHGVQNGAMSMERTDANGAAAIEGAGAGAAAVTSGLTTVPVAEA